MDLSVLLNVFYHVLKFPDNATDMNSYVDNEEEKWIFC